MGYLNNWYKSPAFFQDFAEHETAVCGAVRKNRVKFPKSFITEEFRLGKTIFLKNGNLLALRLLDQKDVCFLSKIHKLQLTQTRKTDREGNALQKQKLVKDSTTNKKTCFLFQKKSQQGKLP